MVVLIELLDEDGRPIQIEVDLNTQAQVLATRELTRAINNLARVTGVKNG